MGPPGARAVPAAHDLTAAVPRHHTERFAVSGEPVKKIDAPTARATSKRSPMANIGRAAPTDTPIGPRPAEGTFPIVGVGASAGGLEAFSNLLKQIEIDHVGIALVLIQHLDPTHTS